MIVRIVILALLSAVLSVANASAHKPIRGLPTNYVILASRDGVVVARDQDGYLHLSTDGAKTFKLDTSEPFLRHPVVRPQTSSETFIYYMINDADIHPGTGEIWLGVGAGSGLYRKLPTDEKWIPVEVTDVRSWTYRLAIEPENGYIAVSTGVRDAEYGSTSGRTFVSYDGGTSFEQAASFPETQSHPFELLWFAGSRLLASQNGKLYEYVPVVKSWNLIGGTPTTRYTVVTDNYVYGCSYTRDTYLTIVDMTSGHSRTLPIQNTVRSVTIMPYDGDTALVKIEFEETDSTQSYKLVGSNLLPKAVDTMYSGTSNLYSYTTIQLADGPARVVCGNGLNEVRPRHAAPYASTFERTTGRILKTVAMRSAAVINLEVHGLYVVDSAGNSRRVISQGPDAGWWVPVSAATDTTFMAYRTGVAGQYYYPMSEVFSNDVQERVRRKGDHNWTVSLNATMSNDTVYYTYGSRGIYARLPSGEDVLLSEGMEPPAVRQDPAQVYRSPTILFTAEGTLFAFFRPTNEEPQSQLTYWNGSRWNRVDAGILGERQMQRVFPCRTGAAIMVDDLDPILYHFDARTLEISTRMRLSQRLKAINPETLAVCANSGAVAWLSDSGQVFAAYRDGRMVSTTEYGPIWGVAVAGTGLIMGSTELGFIIVDVDSLTGTTTTGITGSSSTIHRPGAVRPQPAVGRAVITIPASTAVSTYVTLTDVLSRVVWSNDVTPFPDGERMQLDIDVTSVAPGSYIAHVVYGPETYSVPIIVAR